MKRYCVIFLNLVKEKDYFISAMSRLGINHATAVRIIQKAPVILKADMTLDEARRYAEAVNRAGAVVRIKEDGDFGTGRTDPSIKIMTFENFVMCPRCGYKQLRGPGCNRCGFHFFKQDRTAG